MNGHERARRNDADGGPSGAVAAPGKRTLTQGLPPRSAALASPAASAASPDHDATALPIAAPDVDPYGLHLAAAGTATAPGTAAVDAAARAGLGDVSGVRLHDDPRAHAAADAHAARAFAVGSDVYFAAGQLRPGTEDGDRLLGHELAHTSQQRASGASAIAAKLRTSESGDAAEAQADRAGDVFASAMAGAAVAPVRLSAAPLAVACAPFGQSRPLDPAGQSRPLVLGGQSFVDPSADADGDGHADPLRRPAPTPAPHAAAGAAPIGQSRPLDLRGQSRPLTLGGQSFVDPSRDQDSDGRADLFRAPPATTATGDARPSPSQEATELADAAQLAIDATGEITSALLPTYTAALDALDLAAVHDAAIETIDKYQGAAEVRDAIHARLAATTPAAEADRWLLAPIRGALDAALGSAENELAAHFGVQRFRGAPVIAGVAPIRLGGGRLAAGRLLQEAGFAEGLIATVNEVVAMVPAAAAATAGGVSIPTPSGASAAAARIRAWAGRPVHFAFLRAALSALGVWSQIEHANLAGDLRTLGQLGDDVDKNAARFGAMNDVGAYDPGVAESMLLATPSRENVVHVLGMIESAAPDARGPILEDLQRRGLLDGFAARLSYQEAERLHDSVRDAPGVRAVLRDRYGDDPRTGDNTLGSLLGSVPLIGRGLRWAGNVATFGFMEEHDAAHRAMTAGEMTDVTGRAC